MRIFSDIGSVRLPSRSQATESFAGQVVRVSGWGKSSDGKQNFYFLAI